MGLILWTFHWPFLVVYIFLCFHTGLALNILYLINAWPPHDYRKPLDQYLKTIEEVTPQDIANIARKLITSPLTMASHGDGKFLSHELQSLIRNFTFFHVNQLYCCAVVQVQSYEVVSSRFHSKWDYFLKSFLAHWHHPKRYMVSTIHVNHNGRNLFTS